MLTLSSSSNVRGEDKIQSKVRIYRAVFLLCVGLCGLIATAAGCKPAPKKRSAFDYKLIVKFKPSGEFSRSQVDMEYKGGQLPYGKVQSEFAWKLRLPRHISMAKQWNKIPLKLRYSSLCKHEYLPLQIASGKKENLKYEKRLRGVIERYFDPKHNPRLKRIQSWGRSRSLHYDSEPIIRYSFTAKSPKKRKPVITFAINNRGKKERKIRIGAWSMKLRPHYIKMQSLTYDGCKPSQDVFIDGKKVGTINVSTYLKKLKSTRNIPHIFLIDAVGGRCFHRQTAGYGGATSGKRTLLKGKRIYLITTTYNFHRPPKKIRVHVSKHSFRSSGGVYRGYLWQAPNCK